MGFFKNTTDAAQVFYAEALESPECFYCFKETEVEDTVYWSGAIGLILLHRGCAMTFASHLQGDAVRLLIQNQSRNELKRTVDT